MDTLLLYSYKNVPFSETLPQLLPIKSNRIRIPRLHQYDYLEENWVNYTQVQAYSFLLLKFIFFT